MAADTTALLLVGFQNERFTEGSARQPDGEDRAVSVGVLAATIGLVDRLAATDALIVAAPVIFTPTHEDLVDPAGVLTAMRAMGAFQEADSGSRLAGELERFGARITQVRGRRGLNAFTQTTLDESLLQHGIIDVVIAGALSSVCIDSTARSALERGYRVSVLKDCTMGRTRSEHDLFVQRIFPLYAEVLTSEELLGRLGAPMHAAR